MLLEGQKNGIGAGLTAKIYRSSESGEHPLLILVLHGDSPFGPPSNQDIFARGAASRMQVARRVVPSVAISVFATVCELLGLVFVLYLQALLISRQRHKARLSSAARYRAPFGSALQPSLRPFST